MVFGDGDGWGWMGMDGDGWGWMGMGMVLACHQLLTSKGPCNLTGRCQQTRSQTNISWFTAEAGHDDVDQLEESN